MKKRVLSVVFSVIILSSLLFIGALGNDSIKAVNQVYNISILSDSTLHTGKNTAPCDIQGLGKLYSDAGHNVTFIDRGFLAKQLTTYNCDIVILPCGESFPVEAVANFKAFVAAGGRVITLGGYAFSNLVDKDGGTVKPDPLASVEIGKNLLLGSNAPLYAQDQLRFDASQLPIFDEEHYFDSSISIRPAT